MEKGIQTPMAQGRSTKIISMITWIRTSRLSIKNSLSLSACGGLGCVVYGSGFVPGSGGGRDEVFGGLSVGLQVQGFGFGV